MTKRALSAALLLVLVASAARADDSLALWANYYKEESTRVIEPMACLTKDLPGGGELELVYLVDQITSASGAFTATDEPFSEYRNEVKLAGRKAFGDFTPGLSVRYSHEGDYRSLTFGADVALAFADETTTIRAFVQHQLDDVAQRRTNFSDELTSTAVGVSATQVLRKDAIAGVAVETQRLRGYQENPYRVENHPRSRDRYSMSVFGAYQHVPTRTTGRVSYRFYTDDWELVGHTFDVEIAQRVFTDLEIIPRFRYHTQGGVYFVTLSPDGFSTSDPKLRPFDARQYGLGLRWDLGFLRATPLAIFATSTIEPAYAYLDQDNSYGPAHVAQLGWLWLF